MVSTIQEFLYSVDLVYIFKDKKEMANFIYKTGDMFTTHADAIVNTVNCVGIMRKSVALEFKNRWQDNFKHYKKVCDNKRIITGKIFIVENKKYKPMLRKTDDDRVRLKTPPRR